MQAFNPTSRPGTTPETAPGSVPATADSTGLPLANHLFRLLGPEAAGKLIAAGRRVPLQSGQTLWSPGQTADTICFPLSGVVASLAADLDGSAAQVESTGPEGAAGLIEGLAGATHAFETRAMVDTEAWLVPSEAVRGLMRDSPESAEILQRRVARLYDDARRAAACAARHALRARLADHLLAYQEKTGMVRLPLTQEILSALLGANRTTVTALAIGLSDAGLTRTGRGWISVVDAERLDRLACGCRKGGSATSIKTAPPALA